MNTTNDEDLLELLTKPMSEAELKTYQDLIDGDHFQQMMRAYHTQTTLEAMRQLLRRCFEEQRFSFESVFVSVTSMWLKRLSQMNPQFDDDAILLWMKTPALLAQILLQFALDTLQDKKEQVDKSYPVEMEEMYQIWQRILPQKVGADTAVSYKLLQETQRVLAVFETVQQKLESDPQLKVEAIDYLEIWTQLLLQLYIFAVLDEPELYYLLFKNWHLFSSTLPTLLSLLILLRGYEELLMPQNRDKFNGLMQDPEIQQALFQRLQALGHAVPTPDP